MLRRFNKFFQRLTLIVAVVSMLAQPQGNALAAAVLSIQPITWNIIGLDSNNVSVGPNLFPIGARVCNTGDTTATNVKSSFFFDDGANPYNGNGFINLRSGTLSAYTSDGTNLPPGGCTDFYYEVAVTRDASAYNKTRNYHIEATADGGLSASTPTPRVLFVERLISQNRNGVTNVSFGTSLGSLASVPAGGTMNLMVGNTYFIRMTGFTATQGYEQIEYFVNIPNTIFQILSVSSTFDADSSPTVGPSPIDVLYGDNCVWENDPTSPNYRSCLSTGKTGGNITVTYKVKILQVPSSPLVNPQPLSTLIYDFSGSSFHYNADYAVSTRFANIINASIEKTFSPKTIAPGSNSTLTFTINNPGSAPITDVNFTDDLPDNLNLANANIAYGPNCGTPSPSSGSLTDPMSFSNITVPGNSVCTIAVTVTSNTNGIYSNTTSTLKLGTTDTGDTASDTLVVSSQPSPPTTCSPATPIATWNFNALTTGSPQNGPFTGTLAVGNASGATATYGSGNGSSSGIANSTSNTFPGDPSGFVNPVALDGNVWGIHNGWSVSGTPNGTTLPYFQFQVNASNYGGLTFSARANLGGSWSNGDNWHVLASTDGTNWTSMGTGAWSTPTFKNAWGTVSNNTLKPANAATTYFRVHFIGSQSNKFDDTVFLDNVTISGCPRPTVPTISKAFGTNPISVGSTSVLTFTLTNPNASALNGVSFTDVLPGRLVIHSTPALTNTCGGTVTAAANTQAISLSGGTINGPANTTCSISVTVRGSAAGSYTNTSTNIASTDSGPNTSTTPNVGFAQASLTVIAPPVVSKSFTANPIFTGETTLLTFTINNPNASTALTNLSFTDTLPGGLVVDTTTTSPATAATNTCGGTLTATEGASSISLGGVNTLLADASCSITVRVRGTSTGLKSNSVQVSSSNGGSGNTATAEALVKDRTPAMSFAKYVGLSATGPWLKSLEVTLPDTVYYRLLIENTGDVPLTNIAVTDATVDPSGCIWYDGDGTQLSTDNAPFNLPIADSTPPINDQHYATCVLGGVGGIAVLDGTNTNTASADPGELPAASSSATYIGIAPNLSLGKTNNATSLTAGGTTTYELTVTNSGNLASSGTITMVDVLPAGLSHADGTVTLGGAQSADWSCSSSGNVITCTSSTAIGASGTSVFSFTANVASNASGTLTNKAQVGGGGDPTNPSAPTSTTAGQCTGAGAPNEGCAVDADPVYEDPSINVTKAFSNNNGIIFINPSTIQMTYVITVENTGNVALSNVQVEDDLGFTFPSPATFTLQGTPVCVNLTCNTNFNGNTNTNLLTGSNSLAASGSGTITFTVRVETGGKAENYTNLASGSGVSPLGTTVIDTGMVSGPVFADPAVTKAIDVTEASVGDLVTFTIVVSNNGTQIAPNVVVTDPLPDNLDHVSTTSLPRGIVSLTPPRTVVVDIGNLGVDETITITIVTRVNSLGQPPIDNTATLTTDSGTNLLANDAASVRLRIVAKATAVLPSTGFAPGMVTDLPKQTVDQAYSQLGTIWLEIPSLGVKTGIVGVPKTNGAWNVDWLWEQAGWLQGSAFPTWNGNSVLTGHVYLPNGRPGPFVDLAKLRWGNQIIIHAFGERYIYEVRTNQVVLPNAVDKVFKHEERAWLTLVTCKGYDEVKGTYSYRIMTRAVLIRIEAEP